MGVALDYARHLLALLPTGPAWPKGENSTLFAVLKGLATELARVEARALDLVEESDPRTTNELIGDWERWLGLPDPCLATPPTTLTERRAAIVALLTAGGDPTEQFFIDLAAALGYVSTITYPAAHTFQVNAPAVSITAEFTCISPCTEPLRTWGNEVLECAIDRLKPAHTVAQFAYA